MANIDRIIKVDISLNTAGISSEGFSTMMVCGPHANSLERVLSITDVDELLELGFKSTDGIYQAASDAFAQTPSPSVVKIGRWQCDTVKVKATKVAQELEYALTIKYYDEKFQTQQFEAKYTSEAEETADTILTKLKEAFELVDAKHLFTYSVVSEELVIKASDANTSFIVEVGTNTEISLVEPAQKIDVAQNMSKICDADNDFYGIVCTDRSDATVLAMAEWVEAHTKMYGVSLSNEAVKNAESKEDIASQLVNKNYFRTYWFYHELTDEYPEAGIMARCFAVLPGGETWANKQIAGVTVDLLTETEYNAITAKNGNTFEKFRNVAITQNGKVAAGEWIDVIRFRGWLVETIQTEEFSMLINRDKLPFTDKGIALVKNTLNSVLALGTKRGGIAETEYDDNKNPNHGYYIDVPLASNISANVKAQRVLQDVKFTARLAGAIHAVEIVGSLTYEKLSD